MKQMILTGLSTEQSFSSTSAAFYLVFNGGELRVPCSEEAAAIIVAEMYGAEAEEPSGAPVSVREIPSKHQEEDDEWPDQYSDYIPETSYGDDGVEQA